MNADPLYLKIVERLSGELDDQTFERCAQDLLREAYPSLTPVVGGDDAGMDGAIGTADGPYPLICTVGRDAIGNLRRNLTMYLAKRNGPCRAVFATSQALSPARKRNLEAAAAKLGVTLVNIHDRPYFADRLRHDARWRRDLLGVTGESPALSALPPRGRFATPDVLIGRDEDIAWLRDTPGDLLIVGQPGSGKTYVHQYLAAAGLCLFAADSRPDRLADAVREQEPSVVVVDDAHVTPDLLVTLLRLRAELGACYTIHANCWPGHDREVRNLLSLPPDHVRFLGPLTREQVLTLIQRLGIAGPDRLLYLMLEQAYGMPGLASALCEACKRAEIERVWTGELLADLLLSNRRLVPGERERCVLAAFALGGDAGMPWAGVADALRVSQIELRAVTAALGAGGVVEEVGADRLRVRPEPFAAILVRDVFFAGPQSIDPRPLLAVAPSREATAHALMSARQRGARVEQGLLEAFVTASGGPRVWEHFGWVDAECARSVVERYPHSASAAAPGLLHFVPADALRLLIAADVAKPIDGDGSFSPPRRRIAAWLVPDDLEAGVALERRRMLLTCAAELCRQRDESGAAATLGWAMGEVLKPDFFQSRTTPRSDLEVALIHGLVTFEDLVGVADLWPRIMSLLASVPARHRKPVFDALEAWCFPQRYTHRLSVPNSTVDYLRDRGGRMVSEMAAQPWCGRACRTWAAHLSRTAGLDLTLDEDPVFAVLFADRDHDPDWRAALDRRQAELRTLAMRFAAQTASEAVEELAAVEREVGDFGKLSGGWDREWLYRLIAELVGDPRPWFDALVARAMPPAFVLPFLAAVERRDREAYEGLLARLLEAPTYTAAVVRTILESDGLPAPLVAAALARLERPAGSRDQHWLIGWRLPAATAGLVLRHATPVVRAAAAVGEWVRDQPHGTVREELTEAWRAAVLDIAPGEHWLGEIFARYPDLAFAWVKEQLARAGRDQWRDWMGVAEAVKSLPLDQRRRLVMLVGRENYDEASFDVLVGEDAALFGDWFRQQTDEYLRFRPLDRVAGPRWERMALAALDAGATPGQLADHCTPTHWGGDGRLSDYFRRLLPVYERLAQHPDARLRPAGEQGLAWVRSELNSHVAQERREAVYGR